MSKSGDIDKLTTRKLKTELEGIVGNIGFQDIGRIFDYQGPEVEFFKAQILVEGLQDFHITTVPGITDEQKRECITEVIRLWDAGEPITNL